jgi:excisionase family DNA binding protein
MLDRCACIWSVVAVGAQRAAKRPGRPQPPMLRRVTESDASSRRCRERASAGSGCPLEKSVAGFRVWRSVVVMESSERKLPPSPVAPNGTAPLLDAAEAGRLLSVPMSWVLAEARADRIPHVRLGRYVRFSAEELEDWWRSRARGPRRTRAAASRAARPLHAEMRGEQARRGG